MCIIGLPFRLAYLPGRLQNSLDRLAPGRLTCVAPVPGSPGLVPLVPSVAAVRRRSADLRCRRRVRDRPGRGGESGWRRSRARRPSTPKFGIPRGRWPARRRSAASRVRLPDQVPTPTPKPRRNPSNRNARDSAGYPLIRLQQADLPRYARQPVDKPRGWIIVATCP
jgi:hypothetical protein